VTITTDSVVATVTVHFAASGPALVTVDWGDGTTSAEDPNRPTNLGQPADPPGTAVLRHAYVPPADGAAFTRVIAGDIGPAQSFQARATLTPRFRVSLFEASFRPLTHCDTSVELDTEWDIFQGIDGSSPAFARYRTWDFDLATKDDLESAVPLPGSAFSRDMTMADPDVTAYFTATEQDVVFDDEVLFPHIVLHPRLGDQSIDQVGQDGDCRAEVRVDVDGQLLRPGLSQGTGGLATAVG